MGDYKHFSESVSLMGLRVVKDGTGYTEGGAKGLFVKIYNTHNEDTDEWIYWDDNIDEIMEIAIDSGYVPSIVDRQRGYVRMILIRMDDNLSHLFYSSHNTKRDRTGTWLERRNKDIDKLE